VVPTPGTNSGIIIYNINRNDNTYHDIIRFRNKYNFTWNMCIKCKWSSIFSNILNVSGFTTLNNKVTFISSLNVFGFSALNDTTLLSSTNISGFTTLNNNTTFSSSLNVSGFTTLNKKYYIFIISNSCAGTRREGSTQKTFHSRFSVRVPPGD
jgi:hypothetical protein